MRQTVNGAEAAKEQPRTETGFAEKPKEQVSAQNVQVTDIGDKTRQAKASVAKVNLGAVARGDKLAEKPGCDGFANSCYLRFLGRIRLLGAGLAFLGEGLAFLGEGHSLIGIRGGLSGRPFRLEVKMTEYAGYSRVSYRGQHTRRRGKAPAGGEKKTMPILF